MATLQVTQRDWEASCVSWAKPPSDAEQERCERAVTAIKKAVAASSTLVARGVEVFVQGSYANRTNVRLDSDVDVCIRCPEPFFPYYPPGLSASTLGNETSSYTYGQFRDEVGSALAAYFGNAKVHRGKKAFDIHENTYRVDSDAVAAFGYRQYFRNAQGEIRYWEGSSLVPDGKTSHITSFQKYQHEHGLTKNKATNRRFKALTRIIKSLRNEMEESGIQAAGPIPSFLIECLVWNWPDANFNSPTWHRMALNFLAQLYHSTKADEGCSVWREENNIKPLFGPSNNWTREQVNTFASAAYFYMGGT